MKNPRMLLVLAGALALVLSGCAAEGGTGTVVPASSAAPTTAAEQQRETGLLPPARPFGGDCSALVSDSEATAVLGSPAALSTTPDNTLAPEVTAELNAGLSCTWALVNGTGAAGITVVLLPAEAVSYGEPSGCVNDSPDGRAVPFCALEEVVNGIRLSGSLYMDSAPTAVVQQSHDDFVALFEERASAADPVPVPLPAVGAWSNPVDCAAVVAAGDFSAVPGLGASAVGTRFPFGSHDYATPAEDALEGGSAELPYCWIEGATANVTFVAMGGGRWLANERLDAATPLAIEGYDAAFTSPSTDGLTDVDVLNGPNWLHFQVRFTSNAKALADALFAALAPTAAT